MKLILREYLSSLREREELDALLPDLLSQAGMHVFSRPQRGTRQDGVDVAAVGSLGAGPQKVYLFTIKAGDLTRSAWDTGVQAVRPSLNEILDAYIPTRLPSEHCSKDIAICICCGGEIQESVRTPLEGFVRQNTTDRVSFEEWNGDKLATLIQTHLLSEELLQREGRSRLRKSLALLDEPETSYRHFAALVGLLQKEANTDAERVTAIRQISICVWILFAWAREAENMESAYLSGEFALLHGWKIAGLYVGSEKKLARSVQLAFASIFRAYRQIGNEFLAKNALPHVCKKHALSCAVRGSSGLDVNLKLFDVLGRVSIDGVWAYWEALQFDEGEPELSGERLDEARARSEAISALVSNNPTLFLPAKDDQAIEISTAAFLLALVSGNVRNIECWLSEILDRARFAYDSHSRYPSTLRSYGELLAHPKRGDVEYRQEVTQGSILYPTIALWAGLCDLDGLYSKVGGLKRECLQHCNFQIWYPDDQSEEHYYSNTEPHGSVLSHVAVEQSKREFLAQVFGECDHSQHYDELSAVRCGWWPLVLVASRHYRLPVPVHILRGLMKSNPSQ